MKTTTLLPILPLLFIYQVNCLPTCVSDVSALSMCMRPLFDTWEHIRNVESHASNLLFPVPFYTRESTLVLCNEYISTKTRCFPDEGSCPVSTMFSFVRGQLGFFCGNYMPLYIEHYDCMSGSLLKSRHCLQAIFGMPNPLNNKDRCTGLPKYFSCVTSSLEKECGRLAVAILANGIHQYGCEIKEGSKYRHDLSRINDTGKYTEENLQEFIERERPANFETLRKSTESGSQETPGSSSSVEFSGEHPANGLVIKADDNSLDNGAETSATIHPTIHFDSSEATTELAENTENIDIVTTTETTRIPTTIVAISVFIEDTTNSEKETEGRRVIGGEPTSNGNSEDISSSAGTHSDNVATKGIPDEVTTAGEVTTEATTTSKPVQETTAASISETATVVDDVVEASSNTSDVIEKCSQEDEDYVNACHSKLVGRLSGLSSGMAARVRFPLFNVTVNDVSSVCKQYDMGSRCAGDKAERCADMKLIQLLDVQLQSICFRIESMKDDYECMRETFQQNEDCIAPIMGGATEKNSLADVCEGQQAAFDCYLSASECREGARTLYKEIIRGFGCRVDVKGWLTKAPTTHSTTTRKPRRTTKSMVVAEAVDQTRNDDPIETILEDAASSSNTTIPLIGPEDAVVGEQTTKVKHQTTEDDNLMVMEPVLPIKHGRKNLVYDPIGKTDAESEDEGSGATMVEDRMDDTLADRAQTVREDGDTVETTTQEGECSQGERDKARVCVAPLMRTWIALREARPSLAEMSFPIYKYTRVELLELCDGYANSFLCAGIMPIKHCLHDELIRFAQDHLGYQCSPQNIARFMGHYDCILEIEFQGPCRETVMGESVPGKDEHKCNGVSDYRNCMLPLIQAKCGTDAVEEFEHTIQQFGCTS